MKNALTFNGKEWGTWTNLRLKQNFNISKLRRVEYCRNLLVNPEIKVEFHNYDYKNIIRIFGHNKNNVWYLDLPYKLLNLKLSLK